MYAGTSFLGVQKLAKLEKKWCVFGHIDKFWKGHDGQIKKTHAKRAFRVYFHT